MSELKPSVCVVLAITSSAAFLETVKILNLVRAHDTLATFFPTVTIHVAASSSDMDRCRSVLGERIRRATLVPCESIEPEDLAKTLAPLWTNSESVLIHDASRPFVDHEQFERVLKAFDKDVDAVRPAMPFTETLKILTADSIIRETLDRSTVLRISTPELIRMSAIDINGLDCGWFLPLKKNAKVVHIEGSPSGLRINSQSEAYLMELQQD